MPGNRTDVPGRRGATRDAAIPAPAHLKTGSPQGLGGSNPSPPLFLFSVVGSASRVAWRWRAWRLLTERGPAVTIPWAIAPVVSSVPVVSERPSRICRGGEPNAGTSDDRGAIASTGKKAGSAGRGDRTEKDIDELLARALADTFPASDPVAIDAGQYEPTGLREVLTAPRAIRNGDANPSARRRELRRSRWPPQLTPCHDSPSHHLGCARGP